MAFTARASVIIRAPRSGVWRALLDPETIPMIMPITKVVAPWRLGEAFVWEFELAGKPTRVDGHVHGLSDERVLEYDYVDPHSREVLGRRDVHGVRVELSEVDDGTLVSVVQNANVTAEANAHAEGGWRLALHNLKRVVEAGAGRGAVTVNDVSPSS